MIGLVVPDVWKEDSTLSSAVKRSMTAMNTSENIHLTMQRHVGPEIHEITQVCEIETFAVLPEIQTTRPAIEVEKLPLYKALDCGTFPDVVACAALESVSFLS